MEIYAVNQKGFYFNLLVVHGSHIGEFEEEYAKFVDKNRAVFTIQDNDEICKLEFIKLNENILIQESNCIYYHGMRAYFDGKYSLKKDFFYYLSDEININDNTLSKIYSLLDTCFEEYLNCFSDYWVETENSRKIIFGKVPGMYPYYNAILILDDDNVRGSFINVNLNNNDEDKIIYWFSSDNILDKRIINFKNEESQFNNFKITQFKTEMCNKSLERNI